MNANHFARHDGAFDAPAARHLLRRSGFGAEPARVDAAVNEGLDAAVARLFADADAEPEATPLAAHLGVEHAAARIVGTMLTSPRPERAKLALFWHGHFATSFAKVDDAAAMLRQYRLFEELGGGPFAALLHEVARDPAMLVWLDAEKNRRGHPNENFARELFELFSLGIGNYTEADIQEAARAFTGRRRAGSRFEFVAELHDDGEKRILGGSGRFTGDDVVALAVAHPACPRFLAGKLLRFYGDPEPDAAAITEFAAILRDREMRVAESLRVLFRSTWFFATARRGARIASPAEFVVSPLRTLGAKASPLRAEAAISRLGQAILRPPTVKGWDGEGAWIHSATALSRIAVGQSIARGDLGKAWLADDRAEWMHSPARAAELLLARLPEPNTFERLPALRSGAAANEIVSALLSLPEASTI